MNPRNVLFHIGFTIRHIMTEHSFFLVFTDDATDMLIYMIDQPVHHEHILVGPYQNWTVTSWHLLPIHTTSYPGPPWYYIRCSLFRLHFRASISYQVIEPTQR